MKKIHSTIAIFILIFLGLAGFAWAYFSSQASSDTNSFTSGSMELLLSDEDETEQQTITKSWSESNVGPGSVIQEKKITLKNNGNVNAHHVDVQFSYSGDEDLAKNIFFTGANNGFTFGAGPEDSKSVNLRTNLNGGSDIDYLLKDKNGATLKKADGADGTSADGIITLSEVVALGKFRIEAGNESSPFVAGSEAYLWLNAKVGNELSKQNGSIDVAIEFTLDQDESQKG